MKNLQEFLKREDVQLTLTNNEGEILNLGAAVMVKPYSSKTTLRFNPVEDTSAIFPFTYAILHGKRRIFDGLFIKPLRLDTGNIIEVSY